MHRDLKPENILLCKVNNEVYQYYYKIADFGFAKTVKYYLYYLS